MFHRRPWRSVSLIRWFACILTLWMIVSVNATGHAFEAEFVKYPTRPVLSLQPEEDRAEDGSRQEVPPPPATPAVTEADPFLSGPRPVRIARAPNMFGDIFTNIGVIVAQFPDGTIAADVVAPGGGPRMKIGDNNRAIAGNRVFLMYNHYHNALAARDVDAVPPQNFRSLPVDRYTLGIERTLLDSCWSVEARLPFTGTFEFTNDTGGSEITMGNFGNLGVILKREIPVGDTTSCAVGMGLDLPTGSSFRGRSQAVTYRLHNDAVHLQPFVGLTSAPTDRWFFNAFLQADIAANGNRLTFNDPMLGGGRQTIGTFTEQNLVYFDAGGGYWLYRNPCARWLQGVSGIVELHYTSTIQDTDTVAGGAGGGGFGFLFLRNDFNRVDVLNLTAGIHAELTCCTDVRVAVAAPLRDKPGLSLGRLTASDRFFDAEIQVQVNRRF